MKKIDYLKEVESEPVEWVFKAKLENGVAILVSRDGHAQDEEGKIYHCVTKEKDEELEILGWCADIDSELMV